MQLLPTIPCRPRVNDIFVSLFYNQMKQAQEAITPIIENEAYISWTFVRAAMISKDSGSGHVLADDKQMPVTKIMLGDLGKFLVEQVASTEWIRKAPLVASKIN
jgi:hypothetical protein